MIPQVQIGPCHVCVDRETTSNIERVLSNNCSFKVKQSRAEFVRSRKNGNGNNNNE